MKYLLWTKDGCEWCDKAKKELDERKLDYEIYTFDTPELIEEFKSFGYTSFPQVFHEFADCKTHIGGYKDLLEHLQDDIWL